MSMNEFAFVLRRALTRAYQPEATTASITSMLRTASSSGDGYRRIVQNRFGEAPEARRPPQLKAESGDGGRARHKAIR